MMHHERGIQKNRKAGCPMFGRCFVKKLWPFKNAKFAVRNFDLTCLTAFCIVGSKSQSVILAHQRLVVMTESILACASEWSECTTIN